MVAQLNLPNLDPENDTDMLQRQWNKLPGQKVYSFEQAMAFLPVRRCLIRMAQCEMRRQYERRNHKNNQH